MRVITKITTQKRLKDRFNIFIDNEYAFSVSEDVLVKYHLHKGMEVVEDDIVDVLEADSLHRSYLLAINYLSYRMRSIQEVNDYLIKKEVAPPHIEQIIVRLLNEKILNDDEYARAFVTDQINQTSKGPSLIRRDLLQRGVTEEIANKHLPLFTYDVEFDKAMKWAERRIRRKSRDSYRKRIEKLRLGLMRRGFTAGVINDVIQVIEEDVEDGTEWDGLVHQADKLYRRLSRRYDSYDLINRLKAGLYNRGFPRDLIDRYINSLDKE